MKLLKSLKIALNMVLHSRLRSWLTILGIIIGVSSVVAIISLGDSMEAAVTERMSDFGADIITISPGYSRGGHFGPGSGRMGGGGGEQITSDKDELTKMDVQVLRGMPEIKKINTQIGDRVDVEFMGSSGTVTLTGVDEDVYAEITTDTVIEGRMLDSSDKNVAIVGSRLADGYFDNDIGINKMISIEGRSVRVVGILDSGSSIIMPIDMAYQLLEDKEVDVYDTITVQMREGYDAETVTDKIERKLLLSRHVTQKDQDFSVTSMASVQEQISATIGSMTFFLGLIAAISLLVGTVGIANTMFTSVLEKTKEIGIMKAIGAKNKDIMTIFLINSGLIGFVGGATGVLLGIFLSSLLPLFLTHMGGAASVSSIVVSPELMIIALVGSVGVGILAGSIPAYQASKLKPVDALRYE